MAYAHKKGDVDDGLRSQEEKLEVEVDFVNEGRQKGDQPSDRTGRGRQVRNKWKKRLWAEPTLTCR